MTSRKFKNRMGEHRNYPNKDVHTEHSGEHFTQRGHTVSGLGRVISKDPHTLRARESMLIRKFDTYRHGLNKET